MPKAKEASLAMQPVQCLPTPAARAGRVLHPALLSGLFVYQFGALVEDPARTLQDSLPLVALIQVAYVLVCLPVAGSQDSKAAKKPRPGEKKKQENTGPNPFVVGAPRRRMSREP